MITLWLLSNSTTRDTASSIYLTLPLSGMSEERHHPKSCWRSLVNLDATNGFVKMSANWSSVMFHLILVSPVFTYSRKWWYFIAMCLDLGRIVGAAIKSTHPLLSSKTVECVLACDSGMLQIWHRSLKMVRRCIRSLSDWDKEMYFASVVDKAISVWSLEDHRIGQDAYVMM
jgi:hypothetical protein